MSYFWPDYEYITGLVCLILLMVGLSTLQAVPMAFLIDTILSPAPSQHWMHILLVRLMPKNAVSQIACVAIAFFALKAIQDMLSLLRSIVILRIKYNGTVRVRKALYRHLQDLGPAFHKSNPQGDAIFRLTNDTYGPFGIFDTVLASGQAAASLIAVTWIMYSRNLALTLFAISLAPLLVWANWYFGKVIRHRSTESRRMDASLTTVIQRALATLGLIQAFGRQAHEEERFNAALNRSVDASMNLNWQECLYPLVVQSIFGVGQALLLGFGAYFVYRDQIVLHAADGLTYGGLVLFISYFNQMLDPLSLVLGFSARVQGSVAATERVFQVLDHVPAVENRAGLIDIPLMPREITLKKVKFSYDKTQSRPLLSGINAHIKPGELVAFVGPSGTGKSTLLNLLPRFYDPCAGSILLDGIDVREISIPSLRRHMAIVSQDSPLIAGTILENIRYGNPAASEISARVAAMMAGASEFIEAMPNQYDSEVAEGGQNLSGGQRQRIAIARALLADSPILILDEPTSALDPANEQLFLQTLENMRGQRTVIMVTHRIDTVAACDQIFVMEGGKIVEHGRHEELLARGGVYSALSSAAASPSNSNESARLSVVA